jgi:succinate dehydrogenase/fumarate reductase flavoprotein subunit
MNAAQVKDRLRTVMQTHAGVVRTTKGLESAKESLAELEQELLPRVGISGSRFHHNYSLLAYLELEKMVKVAEVIVAAAHERQESRGAHYVEDFPKLDSGSAPQCTVANMHRGVPRISTRPVQITELHP